MNALGLANVDDPYKKTGDDVGANANGAKEQPDTDHQSYHSDVARVFKKSVDVTLDVGDHGECVVTIGNEQKTLDCSDEYSRSHVNNVVYTFETAENVTGLQDVKGFYEQKFQSGDDGGNLRRLAGNAPHL
ncbi:MAG: hypothetical protein SGBAC_013472 [Bacillariaceae sp.]